MKLFFLFIFGIFCFLVGGMVDQEINQNDLCEILSEQGHVELLESGNIIINNEDYKEFIIKIVKLKEFNGEYSKYGCNDGPTTDDFRALVNKISTTSYMKETPK